jgi:hypothetical protein
MFYAPSLFAGEQVTASDDEHHPRVHGDRSLAYADQTSERGYETLPYQKERRL